MFEKPENDIQKDDRSRLIMIASGVAVLIVIALMIVVGSRGSKQPPEELNMARPGSADFDGYAPLVKVIMTKNDKWTAQNMLGNYIGILRARVQNTGDRELVGLQLRAVALGFNNEALNQKILTPVPRIRETLGPRETMPVEVQLDRIPEPSKIMEMTIELYALKLK